MAITPITTSSWNLPTTLQLADLQFSSPQPIHIQLGAEIFFEIWTNIQLWLNDALPPRQESLFGWVVPSKLSIAKITTQHAATQHNFFCGFSSNPHDELMKQKLNASENLKLVTTKLFLSWKRNKSK
jgi:hypothetical protein